RQGSPVSLRLRGALLACASGALSALPSLVATRSFLARRSSVQAAPRPFGARSGACEGVVEVTGREYPVHLAGGLDEQVLGGRRPADRLDQRHPGKVGWQH